MMNNLGVIIIVIVMAAIACGGVYSTMIVPERERRKEEKRYVFKKYKLTVVYFNGDKELFEIESRLPPLLGEGGPLYIYTSKVEYYLSSVLANNVRTCEIIKPN